MFMADMYNHGLIETAMCNCANSVEDVYHDYFRLNAPSMNHV